MQNRAQDRLSSISFSNCPRAASEALEEYQFTTQTYENLTIRMSVLDSRQIHSMHTKQRPVRERIRNVYMPRVDQLLEVPSTAMDYSYRQRVLLNIQSEVNEDIVRSIELDRTELENIRDDIYYRYRLTTAQRDQALLELANMTQAVDTTNQIYLELRSLMAAAGVRECDKISSTNQQGLACESAGTALQPNTMFGSPGRFRSSSNTRSTSLARTVSESSTSGQNPCQQGSTNRGRPASRAGQNYPPSAYSGTTHSRPYPPSAFPVASTPRGRSQSDNVAMISVQAPTHSHSMNDTVVLCVICGQCFCCEYSAVLYHADMNNSSQARDSHEFCVTVPSRARSRVSSRPPPQQDLVYVPRPPSQSGWVASVRPPSVQVRRRSTTTEVHTPQACWSTTRTQVTHVYNCQCDQCLYGY